MTTCPISTSACPSTRTRRDFWTKINAACWMSHAQILIHRTRRLRQFKYLHCRYVFIVLRNVLTNLLLCISRDQLCTLSILTFIYCRFILFIITQCEVNVCTNVFSATKSFYQIYILGCNFIKYIFLDVIYHIYIPGCNVSF